MSSDEFSHLFKSLRELLAELEAQALTYPLGKNEVREPALGRPKLPHDLELLYAACDGLSLPDVHVGYFIDSAQRTASAAERGEPTRVEGRGDTEIHVFGSDGGGGRFALSTPDGAIYYLPASGAVREGAFRVDAFANPRVVAKSLVEFLRLIRDDVDAFVHARKGHRYLVNERQRHGGFGA